MIAQVICATITTAFAWAMIEAAGSYATLGQRLSANVCRCLGFGLGVIAVWMWGTAL